MKSQKKIAVIYKSKYGATKQYAEWIAETLNAPVFEASSIKPPQLAEYDVIIYGGGVYAGSINGVKLVSKSDCKKLVVFSVGLEDPKTVDLSKFLTNTFTAQQLSSTKIFHLRGASDYRKLNFVHKGIIAMLKKSAEKKPIAERTSIDNGVLSMYDTEVSLVDKTEIAPIVEYVGSL